MSQGFRIILRRDGIGFGHCAHFQGDSGRTQRVSLEHSYDSPFQRASKAFFVFFVLYKLNKKNMSLLALKKTGLKKNRRTNTLIFFAYGERCATT